MSVPLQYIVVTSDLVSVQLPSSFFVYESLHAFLHTLGEAEPG